MEIFNESIKKLSAEEIINQEIDDVIQIRNCSIELIDFSFLEINQRIIIENCIIHKLIWRNVYVLGGLNFQNNIVTKRIDFDENGSDNVPVIIQRNIFIEFVSFCDCWFKGDFSLTENVFCKGSNLLGNQNDGCKNDFDKIYKIDKNVGKVDIDGFNSL